MPKGVPNPAWDLLVDLFDLEVVTRTQQTRVGKLVKELKQLKSSPRKLKQAVRTYKARWPNVECTPEAVLKHYGVLRENRSRSREISESSYRTTMAKLNTFRQEEAKIEAEKAAALAAGEPWPPKWKKARIG